MTPRLPTMFALLLALLLAPHVPHAARQPQGERCVVLLHGLGRGAGAMLALEWALARRGYLVVNQDYRSTEAPIEALAPVVGEGVAACRRRGARTIDFVTHSLGGILVRQYFQRHTVPEARRLVMLGPPNRGSEIVDRYGAAWWFRWFTGPAGQQLGTGADSVPNRLGPIPLEVGVIAGTRSSDPWFSSVIPGPDDGKVAVANTRLPEMRDFLLVPHGHTFMAYAPRVWRQTAAFLADGAFSR